MPKKTITSLMGDTITVDTSDKAIATRCKKAGIDHPFKSGERFDGILGPGVVEGVASDPRCGLKTLFLWKTLDKNTGRSSYSRPLTPEHMRPL